MLMQKKEAFGRTLGVQKDSHSISKINKPKIRIIHIFAPDVIKTDAANFRELVQQLTGKPADSTPTHKKSRKSPTSSTITTTTTTMAEGAIRTDKAVRSVGGGPDLDQYYCYDERMKKGEEEIWKGANSGGGYLSGFPDQPEGFMEQLNNYEFPLLPPVGTASHGCSLW